MSDKLSDIGIKVYGRAVYHVRDSFLIHKSVGVVFGAFQATGNCAALALSYRLALTALSCARSARLTKGES